MAGITGVPVVGPAVTVNASGQLGLLGSSIKFKDDVQDVGDEAGNAVLRLRPASFRYKGTTPVQYGLIAEEVDKVYPSLVARDSKGEPMSVRYQELHALLLNQIQKRHKAVKEQATQVDEQRKFAPVCCPREASGAAEAPARL